jgi:hypothetical protein
VFAAVAVLVAGCGTFGSSSKSEGTTSSSSGSVPFGDRVSALFGGGSQSSSATQASAAATTPTSEEFDCPRIDIRPGASTLLLNASGPDEANAMALRYQGTFVRAARECRVLAPNVNIKVGVQGRIILGPAGAPGDLTVPLRYAQVQESVGTSKVMWSRLYSVPVAIPAGSQTVNFTHISEDLTIPIPSDAVVQDLVIYIGFDPIGAEEEKKKRAPPPRTQRRAR